jgi:hypothetical protein
MFAIVKRSNVVSARMFSFAKHLQKVCTFEEQKFHMKRDMAEEERRAMVKEVQTMFDKQIEEFEKQTIAKSVKDKKNKYDQYREYYHKY